MDRVSRMRKRFLAIGISCFIGWICTYLAMDIYKDYEVGLFLWLPLVMGLLTSSIYGFRNRLTYKILWKTSILSLIIFFLGMLSFAWEGLICILMVAPIAIALTSLGTYIGYLIVKSSMNKHIPTICIIFFLSVPGLMSFENVVGYSDSLRFITTTIKINASPEVVWNNIIHFPQIAPPDEFIFKTGIAYPINANIDGSGVGAVRHCNFSTGSFVEPITVWEEPKLLGFTVKDQPAPLKEMSFYDIHPNHLHGYWVSKRGQFKLTQLPNGYTLVEATTWYVNKIKPDFYWSVWSDYIVHKIHQRVLNCIKQNAERQGIK